MVFSKHVNSALVHLRQFSCEKMLFNRSPLQKRRGLCSESVVVILVMFWDWKAQCIYFLMGVLK